MESSKKAAQRQKLGLARCILKRPEVLVVNEGITNLDGASQRRVMEAVLDEFKDRGVIWALHRSALASEFDQVLVMKSGKVVETGSYDELNQDGKQLKELIDSE